MYKKLCIVHNYLHDCVFASQCVYSTVIFVCQDKLYARGREGRKLKEILFQLCINPCVIFLLGEWESMPSLNQAVYSAGESRPICRGGMPFILISTQNCSKMVKNSRFQPQKFTARIHRIHNVFISFKFLHPRRVGVDAFTKPGRVFSRSVCVSG